MSKYTANKFSQSLSYSIKGIRVGFKSQRNFRAQIAVGIIASILAIVLRFSILEFCFVIAVISLVLICELFNSVIEFVLDATYRNKYSKLVGLAKDMSAGAVLVATVASISIGILLYGSKILAFAM